MTKTLDEIRELLLRLRVEVHKHIIGQDDVIDLMLIAIFAGQGGHILLEGVPGTGKTELIKTFALATDVGFSRVQMTPDLLPGDITGIEIYNPKTGEFEFKHGPLFANFVLIDELNRGTPKVASGLLEAMQEAQVTTVFSEETFILSEPFMVFATQNPIEQDGTYELAEAQADRFLMKVRMSYPTHEESLKIARLNAASEKPMIEKVMNGQDILDIRLVIEGGVYIGDALWDKIVRMVELTRPEMSEIAQENDYVQVGASPRAPTALVRAARVLAVMGGRDFVTPQDILRLARPILRHRIKFDGRLVRKGKREKRLDDLLKAIFRQVFTRAEPDV